MEVVSDGFDPSIGIMHDRIDPERHSFVFDQMEPFRPVVDQIVLKLVLSNNFVGADFDLQSDGVVRLNSELLSYLVILADKALTDSINQSEFPQIQTSLS
jgi:CRISP-associated protein Cas1